MDAGMFLNQLNIQKLPRLRQMLTGRVNAAMQRFGESSWNRLSEELWASPGWRSWVTVTEPHLIVMHAQALCFKQINIFKHSCKQCVSISLVFPSSSSSLHDSFWLFGAISDDVAASYSWKSFYYFGHLKYIDYIFFCLQCFNAVYSSFSSS